MPPKTSALFSGLALAATLLAPVLQGAGALESKWAKKDAPPSTDPSSPFWKGVRGVTAANGPRGQAVPGHTTEIRSRWTAGYLYFLFICPYQQLHMKQDPKTGEETNHLWDWDVAEAFIGSDFQNIHLYKEFELSPQAEWVDLDIDSTNMGNTDAWKWNSGFQVAAKIDAGAKIWYGVMKIPYKSVDARPAKAGLKLRANFFRIQGPPPDRKFIAWQPTGKDSYHVPEAFGDLVLIK